MNNESGTAEGLLLLLIFSLTFSSVVVSFVLLQAYGYNTVAEESAIPIAAGIVSGNQDYKSGIISDNANYIQETIGTGTWVYIPNIGMELQNNNLGLEPKILLRGVQPVNDTYTVTYKLNNSVHADFTVYPRYIGPAGYYNIPVKVTTNKIQILEFHEYTVVAEVEIDGIKENNYPMIKTRFNEAQGTLDVFYNNALVLSKSGYTGEGNDYYAGVMAKQNGFIVESIDAGSINLSGNTDILSQMSNFLDILTLIIIWNVNPIFLPWELNLIFIKTQVIGVLICAAFWARG